MKKTFPILLLGSLLLAACNSSVTPEESLDMVGTCWTDGYEYFVCSNDTITHDDSLFLFGGGNLHEGGYGFAMRKVANDTFIIEPVPGTPMVAVGVEGDTAVLSNGEKGLMLVCFRPDDEERDTLQNYDPGNQDPKVVYEQILLQNKINSLKGIYVDPKTKRTYQFEDTLLIRTPANGNPDTSTFHFFYSFDMPSHTLILSSKEQLWYELTPKGLDLYAVKYWAAENDYSQEKPLYHLERMP